jgi:O-antigen ligase
MRLFLILLIAVQTLSDVLGVDFHIGLGLSAKNLLVNLVAFALLWRIAHQEKFRLEVPAIAASFAVMFLYALVTMLLAIWVIQYPHYDIMGSVIALKTEILDPALFFIAFFYATRTQADVKYILRTILVCIGLASLVTIANVYGVTDIGHMPYGDNGNVEGGRVFGFFGHANETGVLMVMLLPAYIAATLTSRGLWRLLLGSSLLLSLVVFVMTGSRGAIVGLVLGGIWGAILCRNYLPPAKILRGAAVVLAVMVPVVALLGAKFGAVFIQRLLSQSTSSDMVDVSSGRNLLWAAAIGRMMETPISLITGFGWNVYDSMGFSLIPHNHYIALWFELGLVGLVCFLLINYTIVRALLSAIKVGDHDARLQSIACVFGVLIMLVGLFVEQLSKPWPYIWPYLALCLRGALLAQARSKTPVTVSSDRAQGSSRKLRSRELNSPLGSKSQRVRG